MRACMPQSSGGVLTRLGGIKMSVDGGFTGKNAAFREAIAGDGGHPTADGVRDVGTLHVDVLKTSRLKHALIPDTACRRG
jgi:hypothetical protein